MFVIGIVIAICVVLVLLFSIKIARPYERAVIFRLGRLSGTKGPGIFIVIPLVDQLVWIDLRVRQLDVPKQTIMTRDNISGEVDAIVYYHVVDAPKAIVVVEDYEGATSLIAQTMLRDVLGQSDLDTILSDRESLNRKIQTLLDVVTSPWGICVDIVTLRDISLPDEMLRSMARQAEAERERRARVILADGEYQASERMCEAAKLYEQTPITLKLREFQNLSEIAKEHNLIVVTSGTDNLGTMIGCARAINK
ncbi:MAG: SPFH domain-containing protein [Opitutales bacterium]|jgi:regulator of protease activity HflC (stomatin/prohibitin superfamily)